MYDLLSCFMLNYLERFLIYIYNIFKDNNSNFHNISSYSKVTFVNLHNFF